MASLLNRGDRKSEAVNTSSVDNHSNTDGDADEAARVAVDGSGLDEVNDQAQIGVQEMEATTLTWTKSSLAALFIG